MLWAWVDHCAPCQVSRYVPQYISSVHQANDGCDREHLYRRHLQKAAPCHRCGAAFSTQAELEEHQRADIPCPLSRVREPVDEMDAETEARVRRKKRRGACVSEADKWREMYRVLFGDDVEVPSPCKSALST